MYVVDNELYFPPVDTANEIGIVAVGGDLSVERLLLAYLSGIFPWYDYDEPIIWWAPPERMVVSPTAYKPSKSLRNIINRGIYKVTFNQCFREVIKSCKTIDRKNQEGTWINDDIVASYTQLHELGYAKSVEVWEGEELVGGLYGVDLGNKIFCGESMFSKKSNASKVAFAWLVDYLRHNQYVLLDCQVHNLHLESLGAFEINRDVFMEILKNQNLKELSYNQ
ncbi:MAG: leucyl/phenylalanyl-tRNA--protein transferase [Bacteroidota bacterium]|nr:leucyl/phenylalanyl-tRNA--protein transferase [Bacteroidota bacterium]